MFSRSISIGRSAFSLASSRTRVQNLQSFRKFNDGSHSTNSVMSSIDKSFLGLTSLAGLTLAGFATYASMRETTAEAADEKKVALNPKEFIEFPLREVIPVNHNTKIFRFDLQTPETEIGLPVASCAVFKIPNADKDGKDVIRPYTPISSNEEKGYVDFMIKLYPNGIASNYVFNMKKGEKLAIKGPIPKLAVKPNMKKNVGMIAGGTGLTPMIQVAREILKNPEDTTNVTFVFANIAEEDILRRKELDELQSQHKNFKVYYVLEKAPKGWTGGVGYVNAEIIKKNMPPPSDDNLILVCGPPPMVEKISGNKAPDYSQGELSGILKDLGYTSKQVYKF